MKKKINQEKKPIKSISFSTLKNMANTKRLREIFHNHIEKETIPSVRSAWIEYFFEIKDKKIKSKP